VDEKKRRGQFFTTSDSVQRVLGGLITSTSGRLLEPSAGAGHLVKWAEQSLPHSIDAVELDPAIKKVCTGDIYYSDFFIFSDGKDGLYDVVLGNPPYVSWKDVEEATVESASAVKEEYSDKANLYYLFIDRCIDLLADGGELIFIVPKEWLYTSSALPLRRKVLREGSLTHLVDCGEEKLFSDADVPALLIFRFVKGSRAKRVLFASSLAAALHGRYVSRMLVNRDGRFLLLTRDLAATVKTWGNLKDNFRVRVGIVSGADKIFRVTEGLEIEPECVQHYVTTKGIEPFIDVNHIDKWADMPPKTAAYLARYKQDLIERRICSFTETNWWKYGAIRNRDHMLGPGDRFYAYAKTRSDAPFFTKSGTRLYGGGILGLFRTRNGRVSPKTAIRVLNSPQYRGILEAMFLTTANKVSLQPATLEDAPFPRDEEQAQEWLESHG